MVGGTIVEIVRQTDKTWINCQDVDTGDFCAIFLVEHPDRCVSIGDEIWWLDRAVFWTTKDETVRLTKIGNSGAARPAETRVAEALRQECVVEALMKKVVFE